MSQRYINPPITPPLTIDNVNNTVQINSDGESFKLGTGAAAAVNMSIAGAKGFLGNTATNVTRLCSAGGVQISSGCATFGSVGKSVFFADSTGRVGIGTGSAAASAILSLTSTSYGFLPPCMTAAQIAAIGTPAEGLMAYDTDNHVLKIYNGTAWKTVTMA